MRRTALGSQRPAHKAVCDIVNVTGGSSFGVVQVIIVGLSRIVDASRDVRVLRRATTMRFLLCQDLLETFAMWCAVGTLLDHGVNLARWTRVLIMTARATVMILHKAGVSHAIAGGVDAHTALGFLHNRCQDESSIHLGGVSHGVDRAVDVFDFLWRIVGTVMAPGARVVERMQVRVPQSIEASPIAFRRPASAR